MKQFFTLMLAFLTYVTASAFPTATLKLRDSEGRRIAVQINGKRFPQVGRVLSVRDIPAGNNQIKIFAFRNNGNMNKSRLIYAGNLQMQPNYIYRCTIDDYEGMDVQAYCCTNNNGGYYNNGNNNNQYGDYDEYDNDWSDNYWGNSNNGWNNDWKEHHGHHGNNDNNGWGNQGGNGNNGNWNNQGGNGGNGNWNNQGNNGNNGWGNQNGNGNNWGNQGGCMSNQTFQQFKQTVQNSNFDSGKQTIIKTQLQNNWINCNQLRELIELFSFESSKLDVAKFGATRVIDRQNLFNLYNSFSFESSKTEFANYIATLQ